MLLKECIKLLCTLPIQIVGPPYSTERMRVHVNRLMWCVARKQRRDIGARTTLHHISRRNSSGNDNTQEEEEEEEMKKKMQDEAHMIVGENRPVHATAFNAAPSENDPSNDPSKSILHNELQFIHIIFLSVRLCKMLAKRANMSRWEYRRDRAARWAPGPVVAVVLGIQLIQSSRSKLKNSE